jgi:hypothetical protein
MSIQAALTFIQRIRQPDNAQYLSELTQLQDAVMMGKKWKLTFSVAELQQAYRQDWMMRWIRYNQTIDSKTETIWKSPKKTHKK